MEGEIYDSTAEDPDEEVVVMMRLYDPEKYQWNNHEKHTPTLIHVFKRTMTDGRQAE